MTADTQALVEELEIFAQRIRLGTLTSLNHLGFGHYGGSLSMVEALAVLYGHEMNVTPENFDSKDRDHFVLSKGHGGPALYATLQLKGFFDHEWLLTLNQNGTRLPSHPDMNLTPGVDMTTGSLGQGISVASGMAYAKQIEKSPHYTYCIVGDGELDEGQCWEAVQFAAHRQLDKFIVFVDDNKKQLDGTTDEINKCFDICEKFESFGWLSMRVNGHSIEDLLEVLKKAKAANTQQPICIVLDTLKGNGVSVVSDIELNHHLRLDEVMAAKLAEIHRELAETLEGVIHEE